MAGSMNKALIIGRLGQDPKLTYLPSGAPVCEMSVATDESYKNRAGEKVEQTEWHRVKVFGKTAEVCANYLEKGRLVCVEGSIRTRSWDDQQGQKRYMTEIVVSGPQHSVQFLDKGSSEAGSAPSPRPNPAPDNGQGRGRQDAPGGNYGQRGGYADRSKDEELGPAFPSEASGMDDVPF